jgi:hypothetical protein
MLFHAKEWSQRTLDYMKNAIFVENLSYTYSVLSNKRWHYYISIPHYKKGEQFSFSNDFLLNFTFRFSKSDKAVEVMKQLKRVFDPKGILNPYKVLPD